MKGYQGILTAIDFEKAFDSLSRDFLFKSLESFGFGASFIAWIKTFYKNITSCVVNNGYFTSPFNVTPGLRQGDPLSPCHFILVLELLAISIRKNDRIRGIMVDGNEIKLVTFADDMTSFVRYKPSYRTLLNVIKLFGTYSGLKINHDKTEVLLLGNMEASSSELEVTEIKKSLKSWGCTLPITVHFFTN